MVGTTKKSSKISLEGSCKNVVTSLHIEIAYAKTGSVANPQVRSIKRQSKFFHSFHKKMFVCSQKSLVFIIDLAELMISHSNALDWHAGNLPISHLGTPF
jgi:hypothetical protein